MEFGGFMEFGGNGVVGLMPRNRRCFNRLGSAFFGCGLWGRWGRLRRILAAERDETGKRDDQKSTVRRCESGAVRTSERPLQICPSMLIMSW